MVPYFFGTNSSFCVICYYPKQKVGRKVLIFSTFGNHLSPIWCWVQNFLLRGGTSHTLKSSLYCQMTQLNDFQHDGWMERNIKSKGNALPCHFCYVKLKGSALYFCSLDSEKIKAWHVCSSLSTSLCTKNKTFRKIYGFDSHNSRFVEFQRLLMLQGTTALFDWKCFMHEARNVIFFQCLYSHLGHDKIGP